MSNDHDLKQKFAEAAEIAKLVPEHLQQAAFNRALDVLLGAGLVTNPAPSPAKPGRKRATRSNDSGDELEAPDPVKTLSQQLDRTRHAEISAERGTLDNSLLLMKAAREDCGIEWLQPPQIAAVLKDKFLVRVDRTTVSNALAGAGKLVDRRSEGAGYAYRLMAAGEQHLVEPKRTPIAPKVRPPRRGKGRRKQSSSSDGSPVESSSSVPKSSEKKNKTAARSSGRPGPKQILEELITAKFFTEPRTIGDVIDHIAKKRAHTYKATDLSPAFVRLLRSGQLERDQNADKQFVYHEPK